MLVRGRGRGARCSRRCSAAYGIPVAPRAPRRRSARTRLGAGVLACARAALPGGTRRRPADLAAHARASSPRRPTPADAARGARSRRARGRATRRATARRAVAQPGSGAAARSTRSPPPPRPRAPEALARRRCWPRPSAIWTAPHRAPRRRARPRGRAPTRARPRDAARGARPSCAALAAADPALLGGAGGAARGARRGRGARGRRRPAACCSPTRWRSARGASARSSCAACRTASSRAARCPSRSSTTTRARALARGVRARAAAPRGRARARALRCSTRASRGRRRCCSCPSAPPTRRATRSSRRRSSTTCARCSPTSCGSERGRRLLAEVTWPPARGADAARAAPRAGRGRATSPTRRRCGAPAARRGARRCSPRASRESARGLETFAACGVRWLVERVLQPERASTPDPEPMRRGSLAHAVLERTLRAAEGAHGLGAADARRRSPAALDGARTPRSRELRRRRAAAPARAAAAARARGRPRALPAPRGRERRRARARRGSSGASAARATRTARCALDGRLRGHRARRPHRRRPGGERDRARLQGPHRARRRALGARTASSRPRCTCWRCASCSGSSRPARSTSRSAARDQRPRGLVRDDVPGPLRQRRRRSTPRRSRRALRRAARERRARPPRDLRAGRDPRRARSAARPTAAAPTRGSAGAAHERVAVAAFTAEQRAAIDDRARLARCSPPTPARARPR